MPFFSSLRFISRNKLESNSKRIFIFIYLLILFIYLFILIYSYKTQSTISYSQFFIQKEDYEENMTFGFLIENNWTYQIIIKAFDSYNKPIFINNTCDENLNLLTNSDLNLTQKRSFKCFINYKFNKSDITNHQIKIHLKKNNSFDFDEMQDNRIPFIIKFKEPVINHSLDNPFDFSNNLQELRYFYDIYNTTTYRKYVKIIEYKTYGVIFDEKILKSHYLEDYEDSSKTIEDFYENMIGSFRICLSKKKDIFERKYKNFLELLSCIGGFITILNMFFLIPLKLFVNSLDHLRLLNSIKKKKNINDNNKNIFKNFWEEDLAEKPKLSEIPDYNSEDKKKFLIISMCKIIGKNIGILFLIIIFIIIVIVIAEFLWNWKYTLYLLFAIFSLAIILYYIGLNLYKNGEYLFLIVFFLNIIYIGIILWFWHKQCSFAFFLEYKLFWIWPIFQLAFIIVYVSWLYCKMKKKKFNDTLLSLGQTISYPIALVKYINSNLNIDNLLEENIINK